MGTQMRRLPNGVWLAAGGVVALLLAVSGRYGFHRDELYFLVAGRHLDWGYVDQPPLVPLVARLSETVGGVNPVALRVLPAVSVGVVAVLAASMARRFGGGRVAQVFAAATAGLSGVLLGEGHLLSTAVFDYLLWTTALWLLIRILDDGDRRLWLALGATIGVGMENKHLIAVLAVAILIALLDTEKRRLLASSQPWVGVLVALAIAAPNLVWQAANGWPQLEMAEALRARSDGAIAFVLFQPFLLSVTLSIPAAVGLWWLIRSPDGERWRPMVIIIGVVFLVFLATGGKAYYLAPTYPVLLAAGSLWFEGLGRVGRRWMAGLAVLGILTGMLIALPLLPVESAGALDATGELGETVGWPQLVDQVKVAYEMIPPDQRGDAVVFGVAYGETAAVEVLGAIEGLPPAVSGHNNYWLWGPPQTHGAIIGVGRVQLDLAPICPELELVGELGNPWSVENEVLGAPLWLCLEPVGQLADIWEDLRHFN